LPPICPRWPKRSRKPRSSCSLAAEASISSLTTSSTKNAIDWLSRPAADISRVFGGKPVAIIGASPGGFGTIFSQNAWLPVFRTLGADLWAGGRMLVSRAGNVFDASGTIVDNRINDALRKFLEGFVTHVRARSNPEGPE